MRPSASRTSATGSGDLATNRLQPGRTKTNRIFGLRPQERMLSFDDVQCVTPSRRSSDAGGRGDGGASGWPALRRGIRVVRPDGECASSAVRAMWSGTSQASSPRVRHRADITERKRAEQRRMAHIRHNTSSRRRPRSKKPTPAYFGPCATASDGPGALWRHDRERGCCAA